MHVCVGCQENKYGRLVRIFDLTEKRCVDCWICYDCKPPVCYDDRVAEGYGEHGFKLCCEQAAYYNKDGEDIVESRRHHAFDLSRYF